MCIICFKAFARTASLKEHLLHFHAIPLKSQYEQFPDALLNIEMGSARCNVYRNRNKFKRDLNVFKSKVASSSSPSQSGQSPGIKTQMYYDVSAEAPLSLNILSQDGTENLSIDVLSVRDMDRNTPIGFDAPILPKQSSVTCSNNVIDYSVDPTLTLTSSLSKETCINPNLLLLDTSTTTNEFYLKACSKTVSSTNDTKSSVIGFPLPHSSSSPSKSHPSDAGHTSDNLVSVSTVLPVSTYSNNTSIASQLDDKCDLVTNFGNRDVISSTCTYDIQLDLSKSNSDSTVLNSDTGKISLSGNFTAQSNPNSLSVTKNYEQNYIVKEDNNTSFDKTESKLPRIKNKNAISNSKSLGSSSNDVNTNKNREVQNPTISKPKEEIDFHFLLGTTVINGSSMTYNRVEFRCLHCSFACAWRPSLVKHIMAAHKEALDFHKILEMKNIQSNSFNLCDSKLKKYKVMKLSEYINSNSKVKKRKRIMRSIEQQDILGKYSCPVCNKVFRRIRYMRRHLKCHTTDKSHLCDSCGKSFKTRASLIVHHRSHKSRFYHCPQCEFVSNLTWAIHRHRQIHPNGSVVCDVCGTAYTDKSTLRKHRRVHDICRPFPCSFPGCTLRFKSENLRKAHVLSHTTEGRFQCPHCGHRFRHKHHLKRHLSRIHPQLNLHSNSKFHSGRAASSTYVLDLESETERKEPSVLLANDSFGTGHLLKYVSSNLANPSVRPAPHFQDFLLTDTESDKIVRNECVRSSSIHSGFEVQSSQIPINVIGEDKPDSLSVQAHIGLEKNRSQMLITSDTIDKSFEVEVEASQGVNEKVVPTSTSTFSSLGAYDKETDSTETAFQVGLENSSFVDSTLSSQANLGSFEYVTETGEIVQLVRAGQFYVRQEPNGNLMEYRISDLGVDGDVNQSQPVYILGTDGTLLRVSSQGHEST